MLSKPRKTKYNFSHNIFLPTTFKQNSKLIKHKIGLSTKESGIITAAQLNAAVLSIKRNLKDSHLLFIRIFPHLPITKRPLEMPLGRGKAAISHWAVPIKAGTVIFELGGSEELLTTKTLVSAGKKFPIKTNLVIIK